MMLFARFVAPLTTALLLSGCVLGPDHTPPEISLPGKFAEGGKKSNGDVTQVTWWKAFNDSRLNGYMQTGLAQSLTVQQAMERINQADAAVISAGAGSLPSLTLSSAVTRSGAKGIGDTPDPNSSKPTTSITDTLRASWFLDFFGLYRRSKESALASLDAAYTNVDVARLTLLSAVAAAYIDARYYQESISIARQNVSTRRETLKLTNLQLEAGAASRLDVVQAEGLVNSTLATIPNLEVSYRKAVHRLATLLGMPADSLLSDMNGGAHQPVARFSVNAGVPADVIRNRPDIRAAERQLAAAVAQIGVAEAQLYPAITLGGSIGPSFTKTSSAPYANLLSWSFGPQLSLPIFDGGKLKAGLSSSESVAREYYIVWKQKVLTGVEEVSNALAAVSRDGRTVTALRATLKSYQEAEQLATASYKDGASSLLNVLDAQRQVASAQSSLAQSIQQMAQDYVALNVAMGGGYAADKQPVSVVRRKK